MNKNELRELMIKKRKAILNKEELSKIIMNRIMNLDIYKKAKVIALYKSMKDEVDTSYLIMESLKKKVVLLPRINEEIEFICINQDTLYSRSNFGVLEPIGEAYNDIIDLIIVPGVSFDKDFNRLGFGKGYYDRYLYNNEIYKIGVCFKDQMIDLLPSEKHDIKMDMIITENKVYKKKTF